MGLLGGFLGFAATTVILMLCGIILLPLVPDTLLLLLLFSFASGIGIFLSYTLAPVMGFLTASPLGMIFSRLLGLLFFFIVCVLISFAWLLALADLDELYLYFTDESFNLLFSKIVFASVGAIILFLVMCLITAVCYFWASRLYIAAGTQTPGEAQVRGGCAGINLAANLVFSVGVILPAMVAVLSQSFGMLTFILLFAIVMFASLVPFFRNSTTGILPVWGRAVIGWSAFLMPNAWLIEVVGLVLFLLSLLLHGLLGWFFPIMTINAMFIRFDNGSIIVRGGLAANFNPAPTFNMGTFTFERTITPAVIAPGLFTDSTFFANIPNVRNHEIGHLLNLAAFGSAFNIVGFIDQWQGGASRSTYGEDLATTNDPLFTFLTLRGSVDADLPPERFYLTRLSMWVI